MTDEPGDLTTQRAHWLTTEIIAWPYAPAPEAAFVLHTAPAGGLALVPGGVGGGRDVPLRHAGDALPADLAPAHPHLAGATALRLPPGVDVDAALRGQVAVSATAGGRRLDATGLQIGAVLDDRYATDAPLGLTWHAGAPSLAVWAPTAVTVALHLCDDPDGAAPDAVVAMDRDPATGVWSVTGTPAWDRRWYLYELQVWTPATGTMTRNLVTDPYAVALSAGATRAQIVDLDDPDLRPPGWHTVTTVGPDQPERAAIYELHVRDFSARDRSVPVDLRGTYRAFAGDSHGTRHLRRLAAAGMTHVHLLPTCDTATIADDRTAWRDPDPSPLALLDDWPPDSPVPQERIAAADHGYNWGYDPVHTLVPAGGYATSPHGPQRTLEHREMVQALHRLGLGVVADVVHNHTAAAGQHPASVLDRIVPGYYHRLLDDGTVAASTCCPNTAPERAMMGRLVVDAVVAWARAYRVDGFRFDLMGHHPKANILAVRRALDALTGPADGVDGRRIMVYGEGWDFGEVAGDARFVQATQANMAGTGIATFNDRLRDAVRGGGPFDGTPRAQGFGSGVWTAPNGDPANGPADVQRARLLACGDAVRVGLTGNLAGHTLVDHTGATMRGADVRLHGSPVGYAQRPADSVTYVSAHDNETLYDALAFKLPTGTTMADRVRAQVVALATVVFAQGPTFFHGGCDVLRSKSFDRNSYRSGDHFNALDWSLTANRFGVGLPPAADNADRWDLMAPLLAMPELVARSGALRACHDAFRDLLAIAQGSPLFSLRTAAQVQDKLRFVNTGPDQVAGVIAMVLDDTAGPPVDPGADHLVVVINATPAAQQVSLPGLDAVALHLHPVQIGGADPVARTATCAPGVATVPARTAAVFTDG